MMRTAAAARKTTKKKKKKKSAMMAMNNSRRFSLRLSFVLLLFAMMMMMMMMMMMPPNYENESAFLMKRKQSQGTTTGGFMFASAAKTDDDDDDDDYDEEEEESSSAKENNVFHTEVRTLYDPNNSGVFGFQSSEEFKEKVLETRDVWVVQFIAPGCQPCKDMAPAFSRAALSLESVNIKFGAIDIAGNEDLGRSMQISRVPAIVGFGGKKTWNPYRKIAQKLSNEYRGDALTARALREFAVKNLPDDEVARIDSVDELKNVVSDEMPTLVYVTDKSETPFMLKSLAWNHKNRIRVVELTYDSSTDDLLPTPVLPGLEAHEDEEDAVKLVLYKDADLTKKPTLFDGESMSKDEVFAFAEKHLGPEVGELEVEVLRKKKDDGEDKSGDEKKKGEEEEENNDDFSLFIEKKPKNFEQDVIEKKEAVVVMFTKRTDECGLKVNEAIDAFAKLQFQAELYEYVVNRDGEDILKAIKLAETQTLSKFPNKDECFSLMYYPFGENKEDEESYPFEVSEDHPVNDGNLKAWMYENTADVVLRITQDNLDQYLATDPFTPKCVLFSQKDETPGMYKTLAANFKDDFHFGFFQADDKNDPNLQKFNIPKLPAVQLLFVNPAVTPQQEASGNVQMNSAPFPGPMNYIYLRQWLLEAKNQIKRKDEAKSPGKVTPPPHVTTQKEFEDECESKGGLCAIAFIPGTSSSSQSMFEDRMERAFEAAKLTSGRPFTWIVVDPIVQKTFAKAFDVLPHNSPTVTVLQPRKGRYATMSGSFDPRELARHCELVLNGKTRTFMIQDVPKIIDGGESEDENDYEPEEPIEEEFDLNDIMGEETEDATLGLTRAEIAELERKKEEEELAEAARVKEEEEKKQQQQKSSGKKKKKKGKKGKKKKEDL